MAINRNIVLFLFISALLHAGLGQFFNSGTPSHTPGSAITLSLLPPDTGDSSSTLPAQLASDKSLVHTSGQSLERTVNSDLSVEPDRLSPSARQDQIAQPDNVKLAGTDKSNYGDSNESRIQSLSTGNKLKHMLRNSLVRYFFYPAIAQKRGWQGKVIIGIRIEPDGYISQTQLINSSGYNTLDRAALKGAREVKSLPNAVALLHGRTFNIKLPVIYKLQDS